MDNIDHKMITNKDDRSRQRTYKAQYYPELISSAAKFMILQ